MSENTQTPLTEILDAGPAQASQAEPLQQVQPSNDTDPQGDSQAHGDGPADRSWSFAALKEERRKRQAFQSRTRELEEENRALQAERQAPEPQPDQAFWDAPAERLAEIEMNANFRSSRAEFVAEHGKAKLNELNDIVQQAIDRGHPDMPLLSERVRHAARQQGGDPVAVAMEWAQQVGALRNRPDPRNFPTSLESVRNVGHRRGPAWTGPASLEDIFDRRK